MLTRIASAIRSLGQGQSQRVGQSEGAGGSPRTAIPKGNALGLSLYRESSARGDLGQV